MDPGEDPTADSMASVFNEKALASCAPKAASPHGARKRDFLFDVSERKSRDPLGPLRQAGAG